jgi:hypothetical protein
LVAGRHRNSRARCNYERMLRFVSKGSPGVGPRLAATDARASRSAARRMITRSEWLILLTALEGAPGGLDPVRLQQSLFLFSRCPGVPARSKYAFEPGVYGAISDELYEDLDRLVEERMLEPVPVKGAHWSLYKPIDATFERARQILRRAEADDLVDATRQLAEIKQYVSSVGFGELLERVYAEHPEFAADSVFYRAA